MCMGKVGGVNLKPTYSCHILSLYRRYQSSRLCNWVSEASPTLGCSIEISRDIYIYVYMLSVCRSMSVVCQINCVGGIMWPTRMLKVFWGRLNQ